MILLEAQLAMFAATPTVELIIATDGERMVATSIYRFDRFIYKRYIRANGV